MRFGLEWRSECYSSSSSCKECNIRFWYNSKARPMQYSIHLSCTIISDGPSAKCNIKDIFISYSSASQMQYRYVRNLCTRVSSLIDLRIVLEFPEVLVLPKVWNYSGLHVWYHKSLSPAAPETLHIQSGITGHILSRDGRLQLSELHQIVVGWWYY